MGFVQMKFEKFHLKNRFRNKIFEGAFRHLLFVVLFITTIRTDIT